MSSPSRGIDITSSVIVRRPPAEVFALIADPENNPRWQKGMKSCRITSEGPFELGATYAQEARFLGKKIETLFEVTAFEAGRMIEITSTSGTFPIQVRRSVEPVPEGTRVRARVQGDPTGVFALAKPLMKRMVKSSVDGDYARLRSLLEGDDRA
ncbi:MAG: SRPBCC family protein [Sandaracinaceae bacterium]